MQKYYHRGAFYQERDRQGRLKQAVMERDYSQGVIGDYDKSMLLKYLQKKRGEVGKKGQTKWTHLTNEDTTCFDPEFKKDQSIWIKIQLRSGGYKAINKFKN